MILIAHNVLLINVKVVYLVIQLIIKVEYANHVSNKIVYHVILKDNVQNVLMDIIPLMVNVKIVQSVIVKYVKVKKNVINVKIISFWLVMFVKLVELINVLYVLLYLHVKHVLRIIILHRKIFVRNVVFKIVRNVLLMDRMELYVINVGKDINGIKNIGIVRLK